MDFESYPESKIEETRQKFLLIQAKANEHRIGQVWKFFTEAGFEPLLIKGWVTARKHPKPFERTFVDLDLVFSADSFEAAKEHYGTNHFGILIDFHNELRHLDTLGFAEIYARSEVVECGGVQIRVPCEEDHLRLTCVHWLNDGGEYKAKLWDIYYLIENRKTDFDWEKCLSVVESKRRRWIICAIGLCERYLGLNLADTPIENEVKNIPRWLIKTVEKEWASEVRLLPIDQFFGDKKKFWQQVWKRIPPNPIQATIEVNGDFDKYPRFYYQTLDICKRIIPSAKRIINRFR